MSFARAAQRAIALGGKYDGHDVPESIHRVTKAAVTNLAGIGLVAAAMGGGVLIGVILKALFDRPRPDLVPHGSQVATASFPSGHSMMAAVAYLTAAALLCRLYDSKRLQTYLITWAILLTVAIGFSRVYRMFAERDVHRSLVWIGSGKLGFPESALTAFGLGADMVAVGREAATGVQGRYHAFRRGAAQALRAAPDCARQDRAG